MRLFILVRLLLVLLLASPLWAQTTTPNLGLTLPNRHDANWDVPLNADLTRIDTFAGTLSIHTAHVSAQAGSDPGQQINAAQATLGGNPGLVIVDAAAAPLSTAVNLLAGVSLYFEVPTVFATTIHLGGNNDILCASHAATLSTTSAGLAFFDVTNTTNASIHDCTVTATGNATNYAFLASNSSTSSGTGYLSFDHNITNGLELLLTAGTGNNHIQATNNWISNDLNQSAIVLLNTINATVIGNHFTSVGHGVEYWGGDSDGGFYGPAADTLTGNLALNSNVCQGVGGACLWGSMGFNVVMDGNSAMSCGDTCFDVEGSINSVVSNNFADCTGGNFCGSTFFGSNDVTFRGNTFRRSDSGILIVLKYSYGNADPRNRNTVVESNTLTCALAGTNCIAFYSEGDADLILKNNTLTNATVYGNGFHTNVTITGNNDHFNFLPSSAFTAFNFSNFIIIEESRFTFVQNNVELSLLGTIYPQFPAGSIGLDVVYQDYNSSDYFDIRRNHIQGFPTSIRSTNAPLNTGPTAYPHMFTFIADNDLDHGTVVHITTPSNGFIEDNYFLYTNRQFDGSLMASNMNQTASAASAVTAASTGATATATIPWPMPFNDANYSYTCEVQPITGVPQKLNVSSHTATQITVQIQAVTSAAAQATVSCVGNHL